MTIETVSYDQHDIITSIAGLHLETGWFDVDATYGNGVFWKGLAEPKFRFDINPQSEGVIAASTAALPLRSGSIGSVMYDPPFLTYVRRGREGNGSMVMSGRFSGYWRYDELEDDYAAAIREFGRVVRKDGVLVVKCQDIIHNHRLHLTHQRVCEMAENAGFRSLDLFVLAAKHRMPSPNRRGQQRHARIHHSYFLVFKKVKATTTRRDLGL